MVSYKQDMHWFASRDSFKDEKKRRQVKYSRIFDVFPVFHKNLVNFM